MVLKSATTQRKQRDSLKSGESGFYAVGGIDKLVNENSKDKDMLALIQHMSGDDRLEKILENQQIIVTPVVRNGKAATLGYQPVAWKGWK